MLNCYEMEADKKVKSYFRNKKTSLCEKWQHPWDIGKVVSHHISKVVPEDSCPLHPPCFVVQDTDIAVTIVPFPFRHKLSYRIIRTTSFRFVIVIWILSKCDLFQTMSEKSSTEIIERLYGYLRMSISSRVFH